MAQAGELPQRPYLLRAMHAWITDNGQTPHVVVNATAAGVRVPTQYVQDGKIVLNLSHSAVSGLDMGNESLTFQARFSGTRYAVSVPVTAVLGIYARETGKGMIFPEEQPGGPAPEEPPPQPGPDTAGDSARTRKARLKIVK